MLPFTGSSSHAAAPQQHHRQSLKQRYLTMAYLQPDAWQTWQRLSLGPSPRNTCPKLIWSGFSGSSRGLDGDFPTEYDRVLGGVRALMERPFQATELRGWISQVGHVHMSCDRKSAGDCWTAIALQKFQAPLRAEDGLPNGEGGGPQLNRMVRWATRRTEVNYKGEQREMSAIQVTAMFLTKLRDVTEKWTSNKASVLRRCLMNEHTATALAYGIYRSNDFDAEKPCTVAFCPLADWSTAGRVSAVLEGAKAAAAAADISVEQSLS
eukprot:Skav229698  [mRNA]  locus=scaffold3722:256572:263286:- [translate_table: standard]